MKIAHLASLALVLSAWIVAVHQGVPASGAVGEILALAAGVNAGGFLRRGRK